MITIHELVNRPGGIYSWFQEVYNAAVEEWRKNEHICPNKRNKCGHYPKSSYNLKLDYGKVDCTGAIPLDMLKLVEKVIEWGEVENLELYDRGQLIGRVNFEIDYDSVNFWIETDGN